MGKKGKKMRLIDANKVAEAITWLDMLDFALWYDVQKCIDKQPTVDAEPVRHGHWEEFVCSVCGKIGWDNEDNYCPNCGAKMDEVRDE